MKRLRLRTAASVAIAACLLACGGGGGGGDDDPWPPRQIRFQGTAPASGKVTLVEQSVTASASGGTVLVGVEMVDVTPAFAASFDLLYDDAKFTFVRALPGAVLEEGGTVDTVLDVARQADRLVVGYTRQGVDVGNAATPGSRLLMTFEFRPRALPPASGDLAFDVSAPGRAPRIVAVSGDETIVVAGPEDFVGGTLVTEELPPAGGMTP